MTVSININGGLLLDQTSGLQANDVDVLWDGTNLSGLDSDFMAFINGLGLSDAQEEFAADVDGASRSDFVSVTADAGEIIGKLFFSDASGNDFDGDAATYLGNPITTVGGEALFLYSEMNGHVVLLKTAGGDVAAAFYIEGGPGNTTAVVQEISFIPLAHPDPNNPDDVINFADVLNVSAVISKPAPIGIGDDGPTVVTSGNEPTLAVDESVLGDDATDDFSGAFDVAFGTDGQGATGGIDYALGTSGGDSGLVDTASGQAVFLFDNGGVIEGRTEIDGDTVFTVEVDADGNVKLNQIRAVVHADTSTQNEFVSMLAAAVTLTATATDADGDQASDTAGIGDNLRFYDDAPSIDVGGAKPDIIVDESFFAVDDTQNYAGAFLNANGGNDTGGGAGLDYSLDVGAGATGLIDTVTGETVTLAKEGDDVVARNSDGDEVFRVSVAANGDVKLDQSRAVGHADAGNPDDVVQLAADDLVTLTATITDGDGDHDDATISIGKSLFFHDDAPSITVPSSASTAATAAHLGNAAGQTVDGDFGYDLGGDGHNAAFYLGGGSDFIDSNNALGGTQLSLSGTVNGPPVSNITNTLVQLTGEDVDSADFNWSFHYDKDPITAGVQDGVASGTLHFDKLADTFEVGVTAPVEGFSFDVLHTSQFLAKEPTSNTGHPNIVVQQLSGDVPGTPVVEPGDPFFVQFTANSVTNSIGFITNGNGADNQTGNTAWVPGEFFANSHPDWVSATQSTNGVAGDTIQKGELLTLRFFDTNPHIVTEAQTPTDAVSAVALKFDGIGNSEDLLVNLNLINYGADGVLGGGDDSTITRTINVQNSDIFKGNTVPSPWNSEFTLDNNDGLVIIESNDYNLAGEHYVIQGLQIMQSANGLTGNAFDFTGTTGAAGGMTGTQSAFDPTDNDVLKITDIGFVQTTSGTQTANLDFSFALNDSDLDPTLVQHINVALQSAFIV